MEHKECSICLETCNTHDTDIYFLPCTHFFHKSCIFDWLKYNKNNNEIKHCPECNLSLHFKWRQKIINDKLSPKNNTLRKKIINDKLSPKNNTLRKKILSIFYKYK